MKKSIILGTMLAFLALGLIAPTTEGYDKKALGELFTNTSCGPCKAANDKLDMWTDPNDPQYVPDWIVIRYHTSWPSTGDPFYSNNKSQNNARTNFYGVNSVPNMRFGNVDGGSGYTGWKSLALNEMQQTTPYHIDLYGTFDINTGALSVQAHVLTDTSSGSANNIFFVLTGDDLHWNAPNGQKVFFQAMMRMINGTSGTDVPSMDAGEVKVFNASYTLDPNWPKSYINFDYNDANIVVFIQNMNNKKIRQVEASKLVDLMAPPTLWGDQHQVSVATGADVDFALDAGSAFANRSYFMLGSITGTSPGTPLGGGLVLPLKWDLFTGIVFKLANTPVFGNFHSTLDGNGKATANFNSLGPIDPAFVGLPIHFAYTVYGPYDMVSNPATFTLAP